VIKNIIFDFDGVIVDSLPVREYGFREIFKKYDSDLVDKLISYHDLNGGLSRFVKIRYFYNELLKMPIQELKVNQYADRFSKIMKEKLISKDILIEDSVDFIRDFHSNINLHIASGSEEKELRYLNEALGLSDYFLSIYGSPKPKIEIVSQLMSENLYNKNETILIGDSINDYDAAKASGIRFFGYNNSDLKSVSFYYIENYAKFEKEFFNENR